MPTASVSGAEIAPVELTVKAGVGTLTLKVTGLTPLEVASWSAKGLPWVTEPEKGALWFTVWGCTVRL